MKRIHRYLILFSAFIIFGCSSTKVSHEYKAASESDKRWSKKGLQIVIDPGHGGFEGGAHANGTDEKDLCLRIGMLLRSRLEHKGYHVIMTRTRDEHVPLKKRAEIANQSKSQVLLSLHFNAAKSKSAKGIEIFYVSKTENTRAKKSKLLAQMILSKLLSNTGAESRGVKEGNLCVIRETHMPSVLIEGGFMTNDEELKKIRDERYLDKLAEGISEGLDQYFSSL